MKVSKWGVFILLLLLGMHCADSTGPEEPEPIRGSVVFFVADSVTGNPIPGVSIVLDVSNHEAWAATSVYGIGIVRCPVGVYTAKFYASGYGHFEKEVIVETEERFEEVSLAPLPFPDTVAPWVVAYDRDGADLWIVFSEAMDTLSFNEYNVEGGWVSEEPCGDHKRFSYSFSMNWTHRNILQIDHRDSYTWYCSGYEEESPWELEWIEIDTTVQDLHGNRLQHPFHYP